MTRKETEKLFNQFNDLRVMVVGDVMIDAYIWGDVARISPEAPVPVLSAEKKENRVGGAANVALNLKALGATPVLCSVIGNESTGDIFLNLLADNQMPTDCLLQDKTRRTTRKTRIIGNNQQLLRIDEEDTIPLSPEWEDLLVKKLENYMINHKIHALIFQDYNKGVLTPRVIQSLIDIARRNDVITLVDPKKQNFDQYREVDLFKPNFKEFKEGVGGDVSIKDIEGLKKAAAQYADQHKIKAILLTLSEEGMLIYDQGSSHHIFAEIRDIADVSGAGDTVISTAALCLALQTSAYDLAFLANLAGGLVCESAGVVPVKKKVLLQEAIAKHAGN